MLIGKTGNGKSNIIKEMSSTKLDDIVGDTLTSHTKKHASYDVYVRTNKYDKKIKFLDLPGYGDSEEGDQLFIQELIDLLNTYSKGINYVFFVLKVTDNKISSDIKTAIKLLSEVIGKNNLQSMFIVFTHYDFIMHSQKEIEKHEKHKQEWTGYMLETYKSKNKIVDFGLQYKSDLETTLRECDFNNLIVTDFMRNIEDLRISMMSFDEKLSRLTDDNKFLIRFIDQYKLIFLDSEKYKYLKELELKYAKEKDYLKETHKGGCCVM